jgi:hypothetical protein
MILMEFTPTGGSTYRISTEDRALTYQWFGYISVFNSLKISLPFRHGGIARPEFSDITLSPSLIEEIGSIPTTAAVVIKETETDEAAAVTIFDGTALLGDYDRNGFWYILYRPANEEKTTKTTAYNATLTSVATTLCTTMGLTIDTTYARSPSPAVLHTAAKDQLLFDLLSDMLAFFSHGAVVFGTTLYIYDMLGTYTATELDEFDFQPAKYRRDTGYSLFSNGDDVSIAGSFENGGEYSVKEFHTTTANIQTALGNIKTIMEQDIAIVPFKQDAAKPGILSKISLTDESTVLSLSFSGIVTSVIYNYDTLGVEIESSGTVTLI